MVFFAVMGGGSEGIFAGLDPEGVSGQRQDSGRNAKERLRRIAIAR
jgi:hypothetical protein